MTAPPLRWHEEANEEAWRRAAAQFILRTAGAAVAERGRFSVVLAGGETPRGVYGIVARESADWGSWHIYFGDERCVPRDDPARNSRMACETWLEHVSIPTAQIHVIAGERGAAHAASAYAAELKQAGSFDLVLLGLGEDGHTASLFPGREWGAGPDSPDVLAVRDAPKPPPERVSLSAARLSRARSVLFLVQGESKRGAVARWRAGELLPASAIRPAAGVDILISSALLNAS